MVYNANYEAEFERCEAIVQNELIRSGGDRNGKKHDVGGEESGDGKLKDEKLVNLISYFVVNLIECSKKLDFQRVATCALGLRKEIEIQRKAFSIDNNDNNSNNSNYFNLSNITNEIHATHPARNNVNHRIHTCDQDSHKMSTIHLNSNEEKGVLESRKASSKSRSRSNSNSNSSSNKGLHTKEKVMTSADEGVIEDKEHKSSIITSCENGINADEQQQQRTNAVGKDVTENEDTISVKQGNNKSNYVDSDNNG